MAAKGATASLLLLNYNYSLAVEWNHVPIQMWFTCMSRLNVRSISAADKLSKLN